MNNGERLASYVIAFTSILAILIAIVELPGNPSMFNIALAFAASVAIASFVVYYGAIRRKEESRYEEERRLRNAFPRIYAFLESIDSIRAEDDFARLEAQLNQLIETEKQSSSIRWKEMRDLEAIRGIALAKLVQKKRFKN